MFSHSRRGSQSGGDGPSKTRKRARDVPQVPKVLERCLNLHLDFLLQQAKPCNLSMVHEFYANMSKDQKAQSVTIHSVVVNFSPLAINGVLGTLFEIHIGVFNNLCLRPPYREIRHTLAGPTSIARWVCHADRGYHLSFPFGYMMKEARIWVKQVADSFFPGQHFSNVTRDRVCLTYALMIGTPLNFGIIFRLEMRKAKTHKGRRHVFRGLIIKLCHSAGVPEEEADCWREMMLLWDHF